MNALRRLVMRLQRSPTYHKRMAYANAACFAVNAFILFTRGNDLNGLVACANLWAMLDAIKQYYLCLLRHEQEKHAK